MFRRLTVSLLALLALAAVPGCVYYNTFYHATAAARKAELMRQSRPPGTDPSAGEMELLERVVEKSGRVIKLHPDSDWADDALVLMGEALYRQSKYETAEDRFTEFVALYPESEHRPTAEYFLAAVLLAKGNAVSAEEILSEVAFADPPSELSDDALFLIGDARRKRKHHAEAAEAYLELLDRFPRSDRRAEVRFVAAENFVDMDRLEKAAAELDAVAREKSSRQLAFESRIRLAAVLVDLGDTDRAIAVLGELERRTTGRDDLDRILLTRGHTYEVMADFEQATSEYKQVASEHERSEAAAEAHYRIGLIHRDHLRSFDDAVASFKEAKEQSPRSEVATLAAAAVADIESLREYLSVIAAHEQGGAPADSSSPAAQEPAAAREDSLGITDLEPIFTDSVRAREDALQIDVDDRVSALPEAGGEETSAAVVDSIVSGPGDTGAPAGPPLVADATPWPPLIGPMPAAVGGSPVADEEESEVAIARLRVAEIYLLKLGSPSEAIAYYESVVEEHPTSRLAPKAAFAVAWIAEHRTQDPEGAAEAYRRVVEQFPWTEHAAEAQEAIARLESGGEASAQADGDREGPPSDTREGPPVAPPASD